MKRNIISSEPVSIAEVKNFLSNLRSSEELNFRASRTEEYASQVSKLSIDKVKGLISDIEKLNIPRLKHDMVVKIVDTLPSSEDDVKLVIQSFNTPVSKDHVKAIADIVAKYS